MSETSNIGSKRKAEASEFESVEPAQKKQKSIKSDDSTIDEIFNRAVAKAEGGIAQAAPLPRKVNKMKLGS